MRVAFLAILSFLAACATAPVPINAPAPLTPTTPRESNAGEDVIVLALSGGGARAASFGLGVLQGLRETRGRDGRPLLDHVALITSVSGGSILSAYYGANGAPGLDTFRAAYLDKQWRLGSFLAPSSWLAAARGGVNGPSRLGDWLDREVYAGARMDALVSGPRIILNATDLHNGAPFAFTPFFFDGVCSDVSRVRVADAVAASMAVPLVFRPVLVEAHPESCAGPPEWVSRVLADRTAPEMTRTTARAFQNYRAPDRQRFLHLVDGGVIDNLGLTTLMLMREAGPAPSPLTGREVVQARRIAFIVVNAERIRPMDWQLRAQGPSGGQVLYTSLDIATDAAKRSALDAFRAGLPQYEQELRAYRCAEAPETRVNGSCNDLTLSLDVIGLHDIDPALINTPTDVTLPAPVIDALIAGGRSVIAAAPSVVAFRN